MKRLQRLNALLLMGATALALRAQAPQATFVALTPCRVVDTRADQGQPSGFGPPMLSPSSNPPRSFSIATSPKCTGIPVTATAYSFTVSVVAGSNLGYLQLWPTGRSQPLAATLIFNPGEIVANAAIVPAGDGGAISAFVNGNTDLILDINGYFIAAGGGNSGNQLTAVGLNTPTNASATGLTAIGFSALSSNSSGNINTGVGTQTLMTNSTGVGNTALGALALQNSTGNNNVAVGANAGVGLKTGDNNIYIGTNVGPIDSGGNPIPSETGPTIRIGDPHVFDISPNGQTFIAGIVGKLVTGGTTVFVDAAGQLGVGNVSSARYKEDIQDLGHASSAIMDLRPVEFRYKQPAPDGSKPIQFGLIAEEVDKVLPELVVHGKAGEPEGVQYEKLPALLLNELQKTNRHVQDQEKQIESLRDQLKTMQAQMKAGAAKQ